MKVRNRATGLLRSLVVASATLAILLVCFSIYQYSQLDSKASLAGPALTPVADRVDLQAVLSGLSHSSAGQPTGDDHTPKVSVGQGSVGRAHRLNLSLYPREGTKSRIEIWVDDWRPIEGTANEFMLIKPEVRLRTNGGNAIRVTAREGTLEATRKGGGQLDAQRGRLSGDVVIEIDRLTDKERAALPAEQRGKIDPADMVRVELDEIEFDLEYAKIRVPGRFLVTSRDVKLDASDLIIRFNQAQSRVEYMRITQGGRLELREQGETLGLSLPGAGKPGSRRWSLVEWLRTTIQARIDAQQPPPELMQQPAPQAESQPNGDSVPVFSMTEEEKKAPEPPMRYFARFEDNIDAQQFLGDINQSRLQADVLEILRSLTEEDQARMGLASKPGDAPADEVTPSTPKKRMVLNWTGRLVVEALSPDDDRWDEATSTKLTATGSPVRISYAEGDATCNRLIFEPDGAKVRLFGSELDPVVARSADQGTMTGIALFSSRIQDQMRVEAIGPGLLLRDANLAGGTADVSTLDGPAGSVIEFDDRLEVYGHFLTQTTVDFVGGVASREYRVLDRAVFTGSVSMVEDGTRIDADSLTLTFGRKPGGRPDQQVVERVVGKGHVVMVRNSDRLSCREVDMVLTTDREGKTVPLTATARGDVVAAQGTRTVRARDKLIVAFESFHLPAPPFDAAKAYAEATAAGLDAALIDWEQRRREHEAKGRTDVGVRRLTVIGEANVVDPQQALEVVAEQLDCTVAQDGTIETAVVTGLEDRPAFVRLDTFTVSGRKINLNVPDQSAEVPGAGRLTFQSHRDLDGRRSKEPIPISIEWSDWMKYTGRENRAVFTGTVHATSRNATSFDCGQLTLGFEDAQAPSTDAPAAQDWWIIQPLVDKLARQMGDKGPHAVGAAFQSVTGTPGSRRFSKEPVYILATGNALVETSAFDPQTGKLKSRSRIRGPKLTVDLRPEVSKMLIEGGGDLLLEDFREKLQPDAGSTPVESTFQPVKGKVTPVLSPAKGGAGPTRALFGLGEDGGPSKTLITWRDFMWYDFSIDQTRFEGAVALKHFSGAELERIVAPLGGGSADTSPGRRTFLSCDVLTADFLQRDHRLGSRPSRRMGGLSSERLRQFQASGSVILQDRGLSLTADEVLYERERNFLEVHGTQQRKAEVVMQTPGRRPQVYSYTFLRIDLTSGTVQIHKGGFKGQ